MIKVIKDHTNGYIRPLEEPTKSLAHHGVKGMKWGIRKDRNFSSSSELQSWMKDNIKYSEFTTLKSHDDVAKTKSGSCHDQVMFELVELRKMGLEPKAEFLIEHKGSAGGKTHSFVYYQNDEKTYWLENSWEEHIGVHEFDSLDKLKANVTKSWDKDDKFPDLMWGPFNDTNHTPGESLETLVNICLNDEEPK